MEKIRHSEHWRLFYYICLGMWFAICLESINNFSITFDALGGSIKNLSVLASLLNSVQQILRNSYGLSASLVALCISCLLYIKNDSFYASPFHDDVLLKVISIIFGCCNVAGLCMYHFDNLVMFKSVAGFVWSVFLIGGFALLFWYIALFLLQFANLTRCHINNNSGENFFEKHFQLYSFLLISFFWFLWIVPYYPASMDNDVFVQLASWRYVASNHMPWFSSCILGLFYELGAFFKNENAGIFLYILVRNLLMAFLYTKCVFLLKRVGLNKVIYYSVLLFYAITPVWGAYSKHAFKDTAAIGLFVAYMLALVSLISKLSAKKEGPALYLWTGLWALFASLFRNNFIYVIAISVFMVTCYSLHQWRKVKPEALLPLACVAFFFIYTSIIYSVYGVKKASPNEALSIPFQQVARVVKYHANTLSETERKGIGSYLRYEKLSSLYDPILSDPVKFRGVNSFSSRGEAKRAGIKFMQTWARLFFKYPVTYLEAAVAQSYGYYSFTPNLKDGAGNWNSGMTIFHWLGGKYSDTFNKLHYIPSMSSARWTLHYWAKVWDKIPVLTLTDVCAFYTWLILLVGYYCFSVKMYAALIPVFTECLMIMTCIASPVNDCFRYFAPVAASFPVLLCLIDANHEEIDWYNKNNKKFSVAWMYLLSFFVFCIILIHTTWGRDFLVDRQLLREDGYQLHQVDLKALAKRNHLALSPNGGVFVDKKHSLNHGPYALMHKGRIEVIYEMKLDRLDGNVSPLARVRLTDSIGRNVWKDYILVKDDFDQQGCLKLRHIQTLEEAVLGTEFLLFANGNYRIELRNLTWRYLRE